MILGEQVAGEWILGMSGSLFDGEPTGCLNDAPCSPFTRHGASINKPFGLAGVVPQKLVLVHDTVRGGVSILRAVHFD
jgi:hypothetical protein